jgi:hypothetical protein
VGGWEEERPKAGEGWERKLKRLCLFGREGRKKNKTLNKMEAGIKRALALP